MSDLDRRYPEQENIQKESTEVTDEIELQDATELQASEDWSS